MAEMTHFKDVTLLITHYNRCKSLERLLKAFKDLNCSFDDIVVSDDASGEEHLTYIKSLHGTYNFRLITTPVNGGLGNNINKGQDAVETPYTLYIQEDFIPKKDFPLHFIDAFNIMEENEKWDLISLYAYSPYPYMIPYKLGFSEKIFKGGLRYMQNLKFFLYSDHPHLRRSTFLQKFGRYAEGVNVDVAEMDMSLSFIKNKGKSLFYNDHYSLLTQDNPEDEPSTATFRKSLKNDGTLPIIVAKWVYSKIKFLKLNLQLLTKKST